MPDWLCSALWGLAKIILLSVVPPQKGMTADLLVARSCLQIYIEHTKVFKLALLR